MFVAVGVRVGVFVAVGVGVFVGVFVAAGVGVAVGVLVRGGVGGAGATSNSMSCECCPSKMTGAQVSS